jgi:hypothetical protein
MHEAKQPMFPRYQETTLEEEREKARRIEEAQSRFDGCVDSAMKAMRAGTPGTIVDSEINPKQTLADMLSEYVGDWPITSGGPNPCELLSVLLAASLRCTVAPVRAAAEAFAERIAADYATTNEKD